ncbi:MAG: glycosyltransferase family 39 protein [Phycisphaerae bacterium]|nr:glycosyltransferase family 39 protein [Phycisphaerae bacterium]
MNDNGGVKYPSPFEEPLAQRALQVALLTIVAMVVFLSGAGRTALTDPDEGRYALVAKRMLLTGEWLVPQTDGPYFDKPPLYFWLTAASFKLFGATDFGVDFAARLVPAAGAVLAVLATYLLAAALFNHLVAMISAGTLLSTAAMIGLGKFVRMDVYLIAFVTLAMWAFIKGYSDPQRRRWFILMYPPIALGVLTKGPIALLIPAAVILLFLLLQRRLGLIWRLKIILGLAVVIAIAGPWFLYMAREFPGEPGQPNFLREFFYSQHVERFNSDKHGHADGSLIEYFSGLAVGLLPWTGLIAVAAARRFRSAWRRDENDWRSQFLLIWAIFVVAFFAFSQTKLWHYGFPAIVPLAIIGARYMYDYWQSDFPARRRETSLQWAYPLAAAASGLMVALLIAFAGLSIYVHFWANWGELPPLFEGFWGIYGWIIRAFYRLIGAAALGLVLLSLLRGRQLERVAWVAAAVTLLVAVDLSYNEIPKIADVHSTRRLTSSVYKYSQPDDPILISPEQRWSLPFYLSPVREKDVRQLDHLGEFTGTWSEFPGRMMYLANDSDAFKQIPIDTEHRIAVLNQFQDVRLMLIQPKAAAPVVPQPGALPAIPPVDTNVGLEPQTPPTP